jgi:hypothetical protein
MDGRGHRISYDGDMYNDPHFLVNSRDSDHAFGSVSWTVPTTPVIVVGMEAASAGFMGRRLAFGLDLTFDFCFAVGVLFAFKPTERVAFLAGRFADFLRALATFSSIIKDQCLCPWRNCI